MLNIIVLAPPKILLQTPSHEWKDAIGSGSVIFSCKSKKSELEAHFKEAVELILFDNFSDNHLVERYALELAKNINAVNVIALAEIDLLRAARIRDKLGISSNDEEKLEYYRNKYLMKQRAASHGLPVADMSLVKSAIGLMEFIDKVGYPVVVKPVDGRGSNGVSILKDEPDLNQFLQSDSLNIYGEMLSESFVKGDMYQANGFFQNGELVCTSVVKCINSCFEFLNGKSLGLQMLAAENPLRIKITNYAKHLMTEVLPMLDDTLFHLEIFVDNEDEITLCEVGARLGGCVVNEEIRLSYDIDMRLELIKSMRDRAYRTIGSFQDYKHLVGQLNIPPQAGRLVFIPKECPFSWVSLYRVNGKEGSVYTDMSFTNAEIVNILIVADNEKQIENRFIEVESWFRETTKYEVI